MKKGYKVLPAIGGGLYISVTNYVGLNEIGHYRYSNENFVSTSYSVVGMWKPKLIKS
jgi:hypothetical protein